MVKIEFASSDGLPGPWTQAFAPNQQFFAKDLRKSYGMPSIVKWTNKFLPKLKRDTVEAKPK